jgi:hypothetical protein
MRMMRREIRIVLIFWSGVVSRALIVVWRFSVGCSRDCGTGPLTPGIMGHSIVTEPALGRRMRFERWRTASMTVIWMGPPILMRVLQGVILLDEARPGWENEIDVDRLAMDSTTRDILGQLWGSFTEGFLMAIDHRSSQVLYSASAHGFTLYDDEQNFEKDPIGTQMRFSELTDLWREVIRVKRSLAQ